MIIYIETKASISERQVIRSESTTKACYDEKACITVIAVTARNYVKKEITKLQRGVQ